MAKTESNPTPTETPEKSPEQLRREFLKKFGAYTASSTMGLYLLMSPKTSVAQGSDGVIIPMSPQEREYYKRNGGQ